MSLPSDPKQRSRWLPLLWAAPAAVAAAALVVLLARWLRQGVLFHFVALYPGRYELPAWAPEGFPEWLAWQHFLNAFFLVLLVRTGLLIRGRARPPLFWTRRNRPPFATRGRPRRHSIYSWLHFAIDWLWIANGVVFVVLLFATGHWVRVVPTSWEAFPHALSAAVQYASLDWPLESSWTGYNALQQFAYTATVFVAAPLAAASGLRLSPLWRQSWALGRAFPPALARRLHLAALLYFLLFAFVHVVLVLSTGALRNLNQLYAGRDDATGWVGFGLFAGSLVLMAAAWFLVRPAVLAPLARLSGEVTELTPASDRA